MKSAGAQTLSPFTEQVCAVVQAIPQGRVLTYGLVARRAGNPRAARQVARILHSLSRARKLPWHRVINQRGRISLPPERGGLKQLRALAAEGLRPDRKGTFALEECLWRGAD